MRTCWYTDELLRISTAKLKIELGPKRWRNTSTVHLEAEGFAADVRLVDVDAPYVHGSRRRFMICPAPGCGTRCTTLALIPGDGWRCRRCSGYRSREGRRWRAEEIVAAPANPSAAELKAARCALLDGRQALATARAGMRTCEQEVGAAGKTPSERDHGQR